MYPAWDCIGRKSYVGGRDAPTWHELWNYTWAGRMIIPTFFEPFLNGSPCAHDFKGNILFKLPCSPLVFLGVETYLHFREDEIETVEVKLLGHEATGKRLM